MHSINTTLRKENEGSEGTFHAVVSKKKQKTKTRTEGSKMTFTFTKCFRLFTQHLSPSLCHSSGTKELARQTMLLRQKKKKKGKKKRRVRAQVVAKSSRGRQSHGFSYLMPETEL